MSWVSRLTNLFRQKRLDRDLDEELAAHVEEAIESGRSPEDARRAFGPAIHYRERSRDLKLLPWLDALASDVVFGWRQLKKRRMTSFAAVLSLALAIGATTAVFRLVDAVLLRSLPVADPGRLFYLATTYIDRDGHPDCCHDDFDYPTFRQYRDLAADRADLVLAGSVARQDAIVGPGDERERVWRQFVSGNFFAVLGLQPALGRLLTPNDDRVPGGHPLAVLSYDFWTRRFARDPAVLGKTFRIAGNRFQIIGVAPKGFVGTEPGNVVDVFIPAMMNQAALDSPGWGWFRIWMRPKTGWSPEQVRQPLEAAFHREHQERAKGLHSDTPRQVVDAYMSEKLLLLPAAAGASRVKDDYRRPLLILAALVGLVLLVACANVGNLLTAQAAARAREMALRVSIGAGRWRLIQLVLVEGAMLAFAASVLGAVFAWQAAPLVVSMLHVPEDPVRIPLDPGWRDLAFGAALALSVTLLFGLAPALRASAVRPMGALKGGADPHTRRRTMNLLLAAQMAFCILVQFVAGLFVTTFQRLLNHPLGFEPQRLLVVDATAREDQTPAMWIELAGQLRRTPGVESVGMAGWPLLSGNRWTVSVRLPGHAVEPRSPYALDVSSGFFAAMRIGMLDGRDFRPGDDAPRLREPSEPVPGVGIVNEAFARTYFDGRNPVGKWVDLRQDKDISAAMEIVGYVRDAAYGSVREPIRPTVYLPQRGRKRSNTYLIRTAGNPLAFAAVVRREIAATQPGLWAQAQPQTNFVRWQLLRERLLAALSLFFAGIALALAAIGLYGVLNYSVIERRREIGIRMALGARASHVARSVVTAPAAFVCGGLVVGLAAGVAGARIIQTLLFEVKPGDLDAVSLPVLTLTIAGLLATLPPAFRAARIDPAETLRGD